MTPVCLIGEGRTLVAIYSPCLGTFISLINPHGFIDAGLAIDKQTPTRCVLEGDGIVAAFGYLEPFILM